MSSSDMAVETELVHFCGCNPGYNCARNIPSARLQTKPDGPLAPNCKHPLLRGRAREHRQSSTRSTSRERRRGDHRHAQLRLVLIAPELRQQLRHAKVRVLRPPGGTVVRCIQLCDATTRFRWRSSPCKETPHTGIHTHDEEVCRLRKYIEHHRLGLDVLWPVCTRDSFLLLHFGKSWGDAPSSTYRPRRRPPQKPASSEDQLPPHRTISRPSVTCTDSLLHVYTHTLHSPLHWCSHHQHASSCKR